MGETTRPKPGDEMFSVATGRVALLRRKSRDAARFLSERKGFVGMHIVPTDGRCLWLYATENDAKRARNEARAKGIQCGDNICRWVIRQDGVPEFDVQWAMDHGMAS